MHCLYGGYNLHRFSDALGLVLVSFVIVVQRKLGMIVKRIVVEQLFLVLRSNITVICIHYVILQESLI